MINSGNSAITNKNTAITSGVKIIKITKITGIFKGS